MVKRSKSYTIGTIFRRKKHASQSNLSAAVANEGVGEFSQSYNESSITKSGFLRRYRKSKNSENLGEPKNRLVFIMIIILII
jgi:hypothetical protein